MRFLLAVWLLLLALTQPLQARPRPMRFERLSIEEGLSQSVVNCILQDSSGFLWFGTQSGLNRYDGYGFTVYRHDPEDPASLASDWILALLEDPGGDLWIGTEGGGLARWQRDSDSFLTYRHLPADPASVPGDWVVALARDPTGILWIGTRDSGLGAFDPRAGTFRRYRHDPAVPGSLASDHVLALLVDRAGDLWIGSTGGLDRFEPGSGTFVPHRHDPADPRSLSDDRVRVLLEDGRGALWAGTHRGLNRALEPRSGAFERFLHDPAAGGSLSHDWVRSLLEDADGRLWVGTDGGLDLWQEGSGVSESGLTKPGTFAGYRPDGGPHSLGSEQIVYLHQDKSGILWIAAAGAGLNKWNPSSWSFPHLRSDDPAASNNVLAISEDPGGGLWIGTFGGGLERLDRASGDRVRYAHDPRDARSLSDDRVTALLHDRHGSLWVGTVAGGLDRLDAASGSFEHHRHDPGRPESLAADAVTALHEDSGGRLWIGTLGGGLNLYTGAGSFQSFRHDPGDPTSLDSDRVFALAEDEAGRLWLATDGGGLNRFNPLTEAFLVLQHDPADAGSLSSNDLLAVHVDPQGQLWIGTKGRGLDRLESLDEATGRAVFQHYRRADGLPDENIWGIRSGASGALWLATNQGLSRFEPESGTFKNYDVSHGLQANEFNLGAHFSSPSGELFFGGVSGLNAFFPERIEGARHTPPVVLTSFTKVHQPARFERPLFDVSEIGLSHRDYAFSLEFAVLDFAAPGKNRYRYRLEGFEDNWIDNGHRRWVSFTNLDPGRYLLRVQGAGSAGVWNEQGPQIRIAIAPPPWKTWWAYALYALALAAAAGGMFAVYSQHQEAVRQRAVAGHERERVAERERLIEEQEGLVSERERLILERELLAEKHEEILAELARSNAKLGRKNAELERFNYTVTHDLKSPLVTIKGFLGMLQRDLGRDDRERVEHDIRRVNSAADKMQTLLEELLELSRVSDPRRLELRQVRLNDIVAEAFELIAGMTLQRGLEVEVDPELGVVMGDPVRLLQVFQNLLANAIRYMGDEPSPRVEVGERSGGIFFVRDNGAGIDPRFHHKIFELFERLEAGGEGSGVGLAVVKRIVELHGGRVWVESEGEGQGSTFCFTLGDGRREDEELLCPASVASEMGERGLKRA